MWTQLRPAQVLVLVSLGLCVVLVNKAALKVTVSHMMKVKQFVV